MSISSTDVCNMALTKLGQGRIGDAGVPNQENEIVVKLFYQKVVDEELRKHKWNCAITRQSLAQSDYTLSEEYSYEYQLPTDPKSLRVLGMPDNPYADYKIEGDKLLTSESECTIKYIKRIIDPSKFDSLLLDAIVTKLAVEIAPKVAGKDKILRNELKRDYKDIIAEAMYKNMIEAEESVQDDTSWIDAGRG